MAYGREEVRNGQDSALTSLRRRRVPSHARGLIDTSVVIDLEHIAEALLPIDIAIATITLAELAAGPHATGDLAERARRQDRLQRVEATFTPLPFDSNAARAYGRIYAAASAAGRHSGWRLADYLIAATAIAAELPLYTRNAEDFAHLDHLLEVLPV
jgi:predicted nucleic acid-binding protein